MQSDSAVFLRLVSARGTSNESATCTNRGDLNPIASRRVRVPRVAESACVPE